MEGEAQVSLHTPDVSLELEIEILLADVSQHTFIL